MGNCCGNISAFQNHLLSMGFVKVCSKVYEKTMLEIQNLVMQITFTKYDRFYVWVDTKVLHNNNEIYRQHMHYSISCVDTFKTYIFNATNLDNLNVFPCVPNFNRYMAKYQFNRIVDCDRSYERKIQCGGYSGSIKSVIDTRGNTIDLTMSFNDILLYHGECVNIAYFSTRLQEILTFCDKLENYTETSMIAGNLDKYMKARGYVCSNTYDYHTNSHVWKYAIPLCKLNDSMQIKILVTGTNKELLTSNFVRACCKNPIKFTITLDSDQSFIPSRVLLPKYEIAIKEYNDLLRYIADITPQLLAFVEAHKPPYMYILNAPDNAPDNAPVNVPANVPANAQ